ncbi:hypothetical protein EVC27_028 [Rhizobium phage RHph_I1_6]|uniref:Uncharacterized protein n=1 Tax=Rhizobium phage RHph_I1_6 TaxID=2509728 RepID=A0A7S5V298_9CAUD|nr:hypothetical protein PP745_gp028 [Rhizobium phage RHph_I1_6]QIG76553.1 hypothetical protein EVC27_028 [Rhizobium phage RHph_I1_6]
MEKKPEKCEGTDIIEMILGIIDDANDVNLAKAGECLLGVPIKVIGSDLFEVDWTKQNVKEKPIRQSS